LFFYSSTPYGPRDEIHSCESFVHLRFLPNAIHSRVYPIDFTSDLDF
jgi:hypothetical protein